MSEIGIDMWSDVRFTVDNDGDTSKFAAIFCGDKLVLVSDEDSMEAFYENLKEKEDEADNTTNSTKSNTTNSTDDSDENVTNTSNKVSNKTSNKTTSSAYSDDEE